MEIYKRELKKEEEKEKIAMSAEKEKKIICGMFP